MRWRRPALVYCGIPEWDGVRCVIRVAGRRPTARCLRAVAALSVDMTTSASSAAMVEPLLRFLGCC